MENDEATRKQPDNRERLKEAKWVTDMRDHHTKTGYYRAQDIDRILDDPRDRAEISVNLEHKTGSKLLSE